MLNSEEKKKYSNSRVVRKNFLNETKNHNPPLQVKWSVPYPILAIPFTPFAFITR